MNIDQAKVALVFDWMTVAGGAERVNYVLAEMFPEAPIFTSLYNPKKLKGFENREITTSFIQKIPYANKKHQYFLSLMPLAYETFDLSEYDIVISSSHSCAKGIITKPETLHVCYCHSPMRYAWDNWHDYINQYKMNGLIKKLAKQRIHKIRMWDKLSADRVDHFIANSSTTKDRIQKYYNRDSDVIFPMIDINEFKISKNNDGYFLAVGRLTPYKKFDLIVETFNEIGLPLKIVGTGNHENELKKMAKSNIEFLGFVNEEELKNLFSKSEALIFPQLEDFGITPLESMAAGRPVIAYSKGGALDTIVEGETGIFFDKQNKESLKKAIKSYLDIKNDFNSEKIRNHAKTYDKENFKKDFFQNLKKTWESWIKS